MYIIITWKNSFILLFYCFKNLGKIMDFSDPRLFINVVNKISQQA